MGDSRGVFVLGLFVILLGSIAYISTQPANAGVEPPPPTHLIIDNDTGGDCEGDSIGHWNDIKKTCRLTTDLTQGIVIGDDDITLDCKRHSIDRIGPGFEGINLDFQNFVTIKNCTVTNFAVGISLISNHDNTIIGNMVHSNGDGISLAGSFGNTISDNTASDNTFRGIVATALAGNNDNRYINNIANNNSLEGFLIHNGNDNHLEGNTANQNGEDGISITGNDHTLIGNTFNDNDGLGILVFGDRNDLFDNSANHNGEAGIFLDDANDNTLQGNTANHNGANGIVIEGDDNDLIDNNASHNAENGIVVTGEDNELDENSAKHNDDFGFFDDTSGTGTEGTANDYTDNKCVANGDGGSDPTGLCSPQE